MSAAIELAAPYLPNLVGIENVANKSEAQKMRTESLRVHGGDCE
jgi:hypothetical protein